MKSWAAGGDDIVLHVVATRERSVRGGAAGIVFGRNVFQASDPVAFLREAGRVVHGRHRNPRSA